jgi:hypothetical protein
MFRTRVAGNSYAGEISQVAVDSPVSANVMDSGVVVAITIALLLFPSLMWNFEAQYVWPWDQAYYAELSLKIYHSADKGLWTWLQSLLVIPDSRAPLLVWLAQLTMPFIDILGSPERALLLTNLVTGAVTLWLVFSTIRAFGGNVVTSLAGVLALGSTPSFIAFNTQFLVESAQVMTIAGMAWIACRAGRLPTMRLLSGTIIWVALAMLAKSTSLAYVLPFVAYIALMQFITRGDRMSFSVKPIDYALIALATLLVAVTVAWYAIHWSLMVRHVAIATSGNIALLYGSKNAFMIKLRFWIGALFTVLSPYFLLAGLFLAIGVLGIALAIARRVAFLAAGQMRAVFDMGLLFPLCLAGTIATGLLAYSTMIEEDIRLLCPMVPVAVLLFACSLTELGGRWVTVCAIGGLLFNWVAVQLAAQGVPIGGHGMGYLGPPHTDPNGIAIMTRAVHGTCDKSRAGHLSIIGAELPSFNAVSAWLYAEKMQGELGYSCNYTSLGYAEKDVGVAIKRLLNSNADYLVTLPLDKLPAPDSDPFNRVVRPVAEWAATSPDFERVTSNGDDLVIYKRRR